MAGYQNAVKNDAVQNNPDNIRIDSEKKEYGTGQGYLIARLKRDAPEIAEALAQGKYPSVRQAAIAAGIVKEKTPYQKIQTELNKLSRSELIELMLLIQNRLKEQSN